MARDSYPNTHSTSLRLPYEWHEWVQRFAERFDVTPAYVYRTCVREFINRKAGAI